MSKYKPHQLIVTSIFVTGIQVRISSLKMAVIS